MTATASIQIQQVQQQIDEVVAAFQPELDQLQADAKRLEEEGRKLFKFDLNITWSEQKVIFDIPSIKMRQQTLSFDVPQVTVSTRVVIFHTPSIRMVDRVIGKKPEFHGLKVVWTDIIISVPEPFTERQEISLDVPEFRMETTSITLDIPELVMQRTEWFLRLPELRLGDVNVLIPVEKDDLKRRAEELKTRGASIGERMQQQVNTIRAKMMHQTMTTGAQQFEQAKLTEAAESIEAINKAYEEALSKTDSAIADLGDKDPSLTVQLQHERAKLHEARAAALEQLEQARNESTSRMVAAVGTTLQPTYA